MAAAFPFSRNCRSGRNEAFQLLIAAVDPKVGGVRWPLATVLHGENPRRSRSWPALLPKMRSSWVARAIAIRSGRRRLLRRIAGFGRARGTLKVGAGPGAGRRSAAWRHRRSRGRRARSGTDASACGEKAFEPGLLARAHRGFLYIDEANLLEDHLVDLLLDVAASGENVVEREGLEHPVSGAVRTGGVLETQRRASCARNCWIALACR